MEKDQQFQHDPVVESAENAEKVNAAPKKAKKRTAGNIVYDFGVFGTIAWIGVAVLSALSAHEAMHGNNKWFGWLRTINNGATDWLKDKLSKTVLKNATQETVDGYAKGTAMFLTLGMGGNALMAPIKWLEDNRQSNAAKIDNVLGTMPPDPETIAKEPKQTWKSVFSGRLASWGLSYVAFLAMGPKVTGKINDFFSEKATKGWMKLWPTSNQEKVKRWADIAAFDALFTIITAALTYSFSRVIARDDDKEHGISDSLYQANPTASTMFETHQHEGDGNNHDVPQKQFAGEIKPREKQSPRKSSGYAQMVQSEPETAHARA